MRVIKTRDGRLVRANLASSRRGRAARLALAFALIVGLSLPLTDAVALQSTNVNPQANTAAADLDTQTKPSEDAVSTVPKSQVPATPAPESTAGESAANPERGSVETPETQAPAQGEPEEPAKPQAETDEATDPVKNTEQTEKVEQDKKAEQADKQKPAAAVALADVGPSAAGDATECVYANASGGQYADTLCWLDFSYYDGNGQKRSITTQYQRNDNSTPSCSWGGLLSGWTCTVTTSFQSVLGAQFGSTGNVQGTASNANWETARTNAIIAAANSAGVYSENGLFFGNISNYPVTVALDGGEYTFTAKLSMSSPGSQSSNMVHTVGFPTWSGAFLGNSIYELPAQHADARPAIYQGRPNGPTGTNGDTVVSLSDIQVFQHGAAISGYSVVVADAESTDAGEGIRWTQTGGQGFRWLPNNPVAYASATTAAQRKSAIMGNACGSSPAVNDTNFPAGLPLITGTITCAATTNQSKTGTAMLQAVAPASGAGFTVSQTMTGGGLQGVAFGVLTARAGVTVNVDDRIYGSNGQPVNSNFQATLSAAGGAAVSAQTGSTSLSATHTQGMLVDIQGTQLNYATQVPAPVSSSYTTAWQCTKTGGSTTQYWPASGTSPTPPPTNHSFFLLQVGQYVHCTVTYSPPIVVLAKHVDANGTDASDHASDWDLTIMGVGPSAADRSTATVQGSATGVRIPVAVTSNAAGDVYEFSELSTSTDPWQYGYDWTDLECVADPMSSTPLAPNAFTKTIENSQVASATLKVLPGNFITCTYTNTANEPQLEVAKDAFTQNGDPIGWAESVDAGDLVTYKLTFDNSAGTAPIGVDHHDYLADVLDDATYVTGSLRISDGSETGYPATNTSTSVTVAEQLTGAHADNPSLHITGEVPRGEVRTVWFQVSVLDNAAGATDRQASIDRGADNSRPNVTGYSLNNYLVPTGADIPASCAETSELDGVACTHHQIPAWMLDKNSRPADGARLHKGGNTHYQITATKMNAQTPLTGLVFTDDLTHVFKTAGWAPDAAVPGGALSRGIYFFDADGQSLDANGNPVGSPEQPVAAFGPAAVPAPVYDSGSGRWLLTSQAVDLPANAMRAEMWFAVEAGQSPAGIPAEWTGADTPNMGWKFVNYVTGSADLAPNTCDTATTPIPDTSLAPNANQPFDANFPADCRVTHQLSDNYFTIRKDAQGSGLEPTTDSAWGDPTGLTNMVGHEFEIRDDVGGEPSEYPSAKLCRAEYNPGAPHNWDGTFITGGTPDWGENSATLAAIIAYNNQVADPADELPLCGLLYPQGTFGGQAHAGGQDGRWRSEHLSEGDYWLVETKAPDQQINTTGTQIREVPGVQLLAQPIAFKIWQDADGPSFGPQNPQQSMYGRGQLDIKDGASGYLDRCSPGSPVGDRPVSCVNPTGYLMIVKDVVPMTLPLTGGAGTWMLTGAGVLVILVSVAATRWLRRRPQTDGGEAH